MLGVRFSAISARRKELRLQEETDSIVTAIGLMSGTSMDGIDVALLRTDGEGRVERGPAAGFAYPAAFREQLKLALELAKVIEDRDARPGELAATERELTDRHADAVAAFLQKFNLRLHDIDLIGFHGQTVLHRPLIGLTVQIGDGEWLARRTGIPVVYDLRANDMVHGGQGAPLVPVYHAALAQNAGAYSGGAVAFVNIGGISNLTYIGADGELIAFDCGPGNTLIDQWVESEAGVPFDAGGAIASEGGVAGWLADRYLENPFFTSETRLSLDRNDFLPPQPGEVGLHDGARTLAHVTAAAILKSMRHLPAKPELVIVCGGGRHNRVILEDLAQLCAPARVEVAERFGFNGDSMEAEAWAYLAVRSLRGLPITYPGTTGVKAPVSGGRLAEPVILETERLRLTTWRRNDAPLLRDLHGTVETARFLGDGQPWTLEYAQARMEGWMAAFQRDGIARLKLVDKASGRFVGRAGFTRAADSGGFELGYSIVREEWGKGYATEIGAALRDWFFANRPEADFTAFADSGNRASIRVLEKIGMQETETRAVNQRMCRFFRMTR